MLTEFDALVQRRSELKRWWKLGQTIAQYDNRIHQLRVVLLNPTSVTYMGQSHAGAKNNHESPDWFRAIVRKEFEAAAAQLTARAYHNEISRLNMEIEKHRAAVLRELESESEDDGGDVSN